MKNGRLKFEPAFRLKRPDHLRFNKVFKFSSLDYTILILYV